MDAIMTVRIDAPALLIPLDALAAGLAAYLLVRPGPRRIVATLATAVAGGLLSWLLIWFVDNILDLFGVAFSAVTTLWVVLGGAGTALAIANLFRSRWWRRLVAVVSIPVFLATAAMGVNADFGAYRTLDDMLGVVPYSVLDLHDQRGEVVQGTDWAATTRSTSTPPARGEAGTVDIPATASRFSARRAVVYLPPIALVDDPPALPVLYALSGQPGAPADMFTAGGIASTMDAFAARHGGYAPIVVAPDQLGGPGRNPMCVDSRAFGSAATYLLTDVRGWLAAHLRVSADPAGWSVFGYSQGATCAVQFASGHPELFGSALASSSELGPTLGDAARTITQGFGGSRSAYESAQPMAMMAAHAPYRDSVIVFGVGQNDVRYTAFARRLDAAARAAGIRTELFVSPGTAHDWHTVQHTLATGFPAIAKQLGLAI